MDGQSAEARPVRCTVEHTELVVFSSDGAYVFARWPLREVRVDAMHEGGVVHLEWDGAPAALVTVDDPLFAASLRASGVKSRGVSVGKRALLVGAACLSGFAALMGAFYAGAPWLSGRIAAKVPITAERRIQRGWSPSSFARFAARRHRTRLCSAC